MYIYIFSRVYQELNKQLIKTRYYENKCYYFFCIVLGPSQLFIT